MTDAASRIFRPRHAESAANIDDLLAREWLVTNGLGGYASGTLGGVNTWRYHGMLIAAEPGPLGRTMMLKQLSEQLRFPDGHTVVLNGEEREPGQLSVPAAQYLAEFRLDNGIPIWKYAVESVELERTIIMPHRQNTIYVRYRVLKADGPVSLELRPFMQFRPHEATKDPALMRAYSLSVNDKRYEVSAGPDMPVLRMLLHADHFSFISEGGTSRESFFRKDAERGYEARGALWTPGFFAVNLVAGQELALVFSTEAWSNVQALKPAEAASFERERRMRLLDQAPPQLKAGLGKELVLAADQFLFEPVGRIRERVRARALDETVCAVIAGYHWFTDWGRDTLISLEGLSLTTGRSGDARSILRAYNRYLRDGLLPNLFPEGSDDGLYHTADATLWFFHALDRYLAYTDDRETMRLLLPQMLSIAEHHLKGTRFGIKVDRDDGLLVQGEQGYQLTWMDAKVDDWVVTPRRGKAVEINALWYNALLLLAEWLQEESRGEEATLWVDQATQLRASFNKRFWYESGQHLYDVIDGESGDDSACRPNQLLSFSLRHRVLDQDKWEPVLKTVRDNLLTPLGLRSLAPGHPNYKPQYFGDLRARDAAYHQGTVWPWLIGPFIDAWLAVYPDDRAGARRFLEGFQSHLDEACIGSISEICDAESPFTPRGCISQAWSVAEVLRCLVKTADSDPVAA